MCAKNHFSGFLDIWENVEWPRFFWTTLYNSMVMTHTHAKSQGQRSVGSSASKRIDRRTDGDVLTRSVTMQFAQK